MLNANWIFEVLKWIDIYFEFVFPCKLLLTDWFSVTISGGLLWDA